MNWKNFHHLMLLGGICLLLAGCASFAKGVTEAILEHEDEGKDERVCQIEGVAFEGVESLLQKSGMPSGDTGHSKHHRTTKVMMIHGIGIHEPGYSSQFVESLTRRLNLPVTQRVIKKVDLHHSRKAPGIDLGDLSIRQFSDKDRTHDLLFYELTWSPITEKKKEAIEYDNSGEYSYRRASINNAMKLFLNNHISDPLIYGGKTRSLVLLSILQGFCWMVHGDWDHYADYTDQTCDIAASEEYARQLAEDDLVLVTHSLGSRAVVDAIQWAVEVVNSPDAERLLEGKGYLSEQGIRNILSYLSVYKDKELQLYMLANQLPLLQLGREAPEVFGQIDQYCRPEGAHYEQRFLKKLKIVAFSDPNDLFSYAIKPEYADQHMDSRMCPEITNVILNVAKVIDVLGIGEVANPMEAHSGYHADERVIGLITQGLGQGKADPVALKQCTWMEMVDE